MHAEQPGTAEPPPRDYAPDGVRDTVRKTAWGLWRETPSVVYIYMMNPKYKVAGRRTNGSIETQPATVRFFRKLFFVFLWIYSFLDKNDVGSGNFLSYSGSVKGPANCAALLVADAVKNVRQHLWLVWSRSHIALIHADATHRPRTVWSTAGVERPSINLQNRTLSWADGSCLKFDIDRFEATRIKRFNGSR